MNAGIFAVLYEFKLLATKLSGTRESVRDTSSPLSHVLYELDKNICIYVYEIIQLIR